MNAGGLLRLPGAIRLDTCDSTQYVCRRLACEGAPEGTIVLAGEQTGGHGREGRVWHSPAGAGLYTSFLLRPRLDPRWWIAFTSLVALALAEALETLGPPVPPRRGQADPWIRIKWPNDVHGREGKLAGILAETEGPAVVVGVGLNVSPSRDAFPPEIRDRASSLRIEGFDPLPTAETILPAFDATLTPAYTRWLAGDRSFLAAGLRRRSMLAGRSIRLRLPGPAVLEGIAREVGECGELILETAEGQRVVVSGEVDGIGPPPVPGASD